MKFAIYMAAILLCAPALAKDFSIVAQEYPPFNWTENGAIKGGMIDVVRRACDKIKYSCHFTMVPLKRGLVMVEEGSADAFMSLVTSAERAKWAHFSPTIITSNLSYFGAKGEAKKLEDMSELEGYTVGTVRGSASYNMAIEDQKRGKGFVLVEETSNEVVFKKLKGGRYGAKAAIIGNNAVLPYEARKVSLELEEILTGPKVNFVLGMSKKKVDAATVADFNRALDEMKKSGEMQSILAKFSLKTDL